MSQWDGEDDELLAVACEAVRRSPGGEALHSLGWYELLGDLGSHQSRAAVHAVFRAQGRELGDSPALGALLAQPYPGSGEHPPGAVAATCARRSRRRGEIVVLVGPPPTDELLVDRRGTGVTMVPVPRARLHPIGVPGRMTLHEVEVPPGAGTVVLSDADAEVPRRRSAYLGRVAAAHEMLGASESVLALAVEYAGQRRQFGQPIGGFQAVRHLLAWARAECAAVAAVASKAVRLDDAGVGDLDVVVKALAGRNGRRVCERTLQTFGGIGFTDEHAHHHFHSRVLALDALLGRSHDLFADLGAGLRAAGRVPSMAPALLAEAPTEVSRSPGGTSP